MEGDSIQFSLFIQLVIPTLVFSQTIPVTEVKQGENVTLTCNVTGKESGLFYWYKMKCGYLIQTVVTGYFESVNLKEPFKVFSFKFKVIKVGNVYSLIIRNIQKEDEAIYFCQAGTAYKMPFINVIKLEVIVNGKTNPLNQNPDTASTKPRDTLILQCSLFSTSNETRPQYPKNNLVHWFKAESGSSHPSIIYTASKSTDYAGKRSCVYHLSKTLKDSLDFGTYYCAVVLCGEILLGGGSTLEKSMYSQPSQSLIISFFLQAREDANYAAVLELCATNRRQWKKMKENTECVYSIVRADSRKHSSSN
uniref:Ig-like domain-containing protein n=1 Tax=Cyprinodon variegatus TaxID=28743 RepID=A0A3Q2CKN3_CYPVA